MRNAAGLKRPHYAGMRTFRMPAIEDGIARGYAFMSSDCKVCRNLKVFFRDFGPLNDGTVKITQLDVEDVYANYQLLKDLEVAYDDQGNGIPCVFMNGRF